MGNKKYKFRIVVSCLCFFLTSFSYANDFYNSLVDDLLNCSLFGYKGIDLTSGQIDLSNLPGEKGFITCSSDDSFYIPSEKGFFRVVNDDNEIFYTRSGDFIKRNGKYYLRYGNYKLTTEIEYENGRYFTKIYHPKQFCQIARTGNMFSFSEVEEIEEEIIPNRLEIPNTDAIQILLTMKSLLCQTDGEYQVQLEIINRMLDVLISDKMHEYLIRQELIQIESEKYRLVNDLETVDELYFAYSTNWCRTFSDYIKMLYIE